MKKGQSVRNCNPYARGKRFEYRTKNYLEKRGWFVARQARSSLPDLIALKDGMILLVECKLGGYMSPKDRRHLIFLARRRTGGKAVLAFRGGTGLLLKEISTKWSKIDRTFDLKFPK